MRKLSLLLLPLLLLASSGPAADVGGEGPLTNEEIVMRSVRGEPVDGLLEAIRTREPAFDLDPEILEEMRIAGVADAIIAAMRARTAELAPDAEPPAPDTTTPGPTITLRFAEEDEAPPVLLLPGVVADAALASAHAFDGPAWIDDIAIFLVCTTSVHVPDHWRAASPLGSDFVQMPRHRLIAFHAGAVGVDAGNRRKALRRTLGRTAFRELVAAWPEGKPAFFELAVPRILTARPSTEFVREHDLALGLAVHTGDRWIVLRLAERLGVTPAATLELPATVRAGLGLSGLDVEVAFGN